VRFVTDDLPTAFATVPPEQFPFTVDFFRVTDPNGAHLLHRITVTGPGAVRVPALAGNGVPVWVRITYPGGLVDETWPEGTSRPEGHS
jgi:hypothetical protein